MDVVDAGAIMYKEPVLTLTLYKLEPECVNYSWRMEQVFSPDRPESVEQLQVMASIIKQALKQSERLALGDYIKTSRDMRRQMLEEREKAVPPPTSDAVS